MIDLSSVTGEEKVFCAHISDLVQRCEKNYTPQFTRFLDERQAALAQQVLRRAGWQDHLLWGGYEEASRRILGVFPPYLPCGPEEFPLRPVTFTYRTGDVLTHRDLLGSLMALKIKREALGDILLEPGRAVAFLCGPAAELALSEVTKIGRVGVKASGEPPKSLPDPPQLQAINGVVSSMRLDCVVALVTRLSREKAAQLIRSGLVSVEFFPCQDADRQLEEGERLSIRGYGKYKLGEPGSISKKGRLHLTVYKYI